MNEKCFGKYHHNFPSNLIKTTSKLSWNFSIFPSLNVIKLFLDIHRWTKKQIIFFDFIWRRKIFKEQVTRRRKIDNWVGWKMNQHFFPVLKSSRKSFPKEVCCEMMEGWRKIVGELWNVIGINKEPFSWNKRHKEKRKNMFYVAKHHKSRN